MGLLEVSADFAFQSPHLSVLLPNPESTRILAESSRDSLVVKENDDLSSSESSIMLIELQEPHGGRRRTSVPWSSSHALAA